MTSTVSTDQPRLVTDKTQRTGCQNPHQYTFLAHYSFNSFLFSKKTRKFDNLLGTSSMKIRQPNDNLNAVVNKNILYILYKSQYMMFNTNLM